MNKSVANNMSIIPNELDKWSIKTINELIELNDIESHDFDFKGNKIKDLAKHLCAFANTQGGFLVLGVDEIENNQIKIGFKKNGFNVGKEDQVKNDIRNFQVQIEPTPDIEIKIITDDKIFFLVIKIQENKFKKPYMLKDKGSFYVRVGGSTTPALRTTILELFSDVKKQIENLDNLKASVIIMKEELFQRIQKMDKISSAVGNIVPRIDLTLLRNNVVTCQSFFVEKDLLGKTGKNMEHEGITTILHTLDTLNSYIDAFTNSTHSELKRRWQEQILEPQYTLCQAIKKVDPFMDKLLKTIDAHLEKIK